MDDGSRKAKTGHFEAFNHHSANFGVPQHFISNAPRRYVGYYQNEHGEQFIFVYDKDGKKGVLWMGDNGWDHLIAIKDPQKPDVVLSKNEWIWLQSCWMAATAFGNK